jgi:hypothetical protein
MLSIHLRLGLPSGLFPSGFSTNNLYVQEILVYIKSNLNAFVTNLGVNSHNRRKKDDLFIVPCNTSLCQSNFNNTRIGLRLLNHLPQYIKVISILHKFKNTLNTFILDHCFYSIDEFLMFGDKP